MAVMEQNAAKPQGGAFSDGVRLYIWAIVILVIAELIGAISINAGHGKIVLLPMVWALLLGAALGLAQGRLPRFAQIDLPMQHKAAAILQPALLLFVAKLGLLVGGSLPKLVAAGWALVFQEFGHFVGTIILGLPVALMLGIKREAIGATFSVGREPSLAIIGEKYGFDSPEGRGVLAEYLTGTIFGAVFISLFAGFIASLNIFNPHALAMGAGVGSGSMMAAAAGAIAAQQTPEVAKEVATFAAASNLITTTIGTYFTLFISLPLAVWGYRVMEPVLGRMTKRGRANAEAAAVADAEAAQELKQASKAHTVDMNFGARLFAWVFSGALALLGNSMAFNTSFIDGVPGMLVIIGAVLVGEALYYVTRRKVPAVCWVSLVAMFLTSPAFPYAPIVEQFTGKINFLSLVTPMLTFAGLSVAKDVPAFRKLGWRIVVVSFLANAGTFMGAAVIAQFFTHP
ncbi:hypothetical protein PPN31114_04299 [Pandoraea pneumonica]|uniref:Branched-chain amino acid ABC transporter permease n=1 Tax=Pandoraea pneumonica TaxID=2508299 RepID=A0A5E4Y593_9BURK|nr:DUF3100 domain-containing protein [Pandoraea pneumonica]VVE43770.1 hypothetical protein PPN31114_04299 [Pandoraea pneumonica]